MKVIVFGATGLVGKHIVTESLKLGNEVTAYTRQAEFSIDGVKVISGELNNEAKISEIIKDYDAIVCTIGNRDLDDPTQVLTPFVKLIAKRILQEQRFIVVAGSGLTLLNFNTLRRDLPGQPAFLKNPRADHWDAYCYLAALDINYLVICPTMIVEGNADGHYLFEEKYFPKSESKQIFAGNVAHFIAKEINEQRYNQTRIGLVNKV
jgi:putative NADH-flavin reductase